MLKIEKKSFTKILRIFRKNGDDVTFRAVSENECLGELLAGPTITMKRLQSNHPINDSASNVPPSTQKSTLSKALRELLR